MKLNTRIVIIVLEIGLVPLLLSGFIGYATAKNQLIQGTVTKLDAIAQIQKNRLQNILDNKRELLNLFVNRPALFPNLGGLSATSSAELLTALDNNLFAAQTGGTNIKNIFVANLAGTIVSATDPAVVGTDISQEDFFKIGIKQNDLSVLKKDALTGLVTQYIARPLSLEGKTLGLAAMAVGADDIIALANDYTGLGDTGETLLVKNDGHGNALFLTPTRTDPGAVLNLTITKDQVNVPAVHAVAGEEEVFYNAVDYRQQPVFAATRYLKDVNWGIVVKMDQAEALAPLKKLQGLFWFLAAMAGLLVVFIGVLTARSITAPLKKLVGYTDQLGKGDFTTATTTWPKDEIGILGRAFDAMAAKLKKSYDTLESKVRGRTQDLERAKIAAHNVLEDFEEEKRRAESLARDLEKFKLAIESTTEQIIITDKAGIVIYANPSIEKFTGYAPAEAIGLKVGKLWGGHMAKPFYENMWQTILVDKKTFIGELMNTRKNGEAYASNLIISPMLDRAGAVEFFVAVERDITKEKQIDKAKTEFVSLASHQLRTPLAAIKWYSEMLLAGDAGALNKEQTKYLDEVYGSNQRMVELVNALLNVSRLELGTFMVEPVLVDVVKLAQSVVVEQKPKIDQKKLKFQEQYDPNLSKFKADPKLLRMVLQNILANAVKYIPDQGTIALSIALDGQKNLLIKVADTGYGIPAKEQDKIFTKFFRADNVREKDTEGTGLGLYIVKSIVDQAGGKVWFSSPDKSALGGESAANPGTAFYVSLPLAGMKKKAGTKTLE